MSAVSESNADRPTFEELLEEPFRRMEGDSSDEHYGPYQNCFDRLDELERELDEFLAEHEQPVGRA